MHTMMIKISMYGWFIAYIAFATECVGDIFGNRDDLQMDFCQSLERVLQNVKVSVLHHSTIRFVTILPELLLAAHITFFSRDIVDQKNKMMNQLSNALFTMNLIIFFSVLLHNYSPHRRNCNLEERKACIQTIYVDMVLVIHYCLSRTTHCPTMKMKY